MPYAQRLARSLLAEHCHEGTFEVAFDPDLVEGVAEALRKMDCAVECHPFKPVLRITCPCGAGQPSS